MTAKHPRAADYLAGILTHKLSTDWHRLWDAECKQSHPMAINALLKFSVVKRPCPGFPGTLEWRYETVRQAVLMLEKIGVVEVDRSGSCNLVRLIK